MPAFYGVLKKTLFKPTFMFIITFFVSLIKHNASESKRQKTAGLFSLLKRCISNVYD
jgi:hypothetical protein